MIGAADFSGASVFSGSAVFSASAVSDAAGVETGLSDFFGFPLLTTSTNMIPMINTTTNPIMIQKNFVGLSFGFPGFAAGTSSVCSSSLSGSVVSEVISSSSISSRSSAGRAVFFVSAVRRSSARSDRSFSFSCSTRSSSPYTRYSSPLGIVFLLFCTYQMPQKLIKQRLDTVCFGVESKACGIPSKLVSAVETKRTYSLSL